MMRKVKKETLKNNQFYKRASSFAYRKAKEKKEYHAVTGALEYLTKKNPLCKKNRR